MFNRLPWGHASIGAYAPMEKGPVTAAVSSRSIPPLSARPTVTACSIRRSFRPHGKRGYRFVAHRSPKVFVAYVQEDAAAVDRLCDQLEESGFDAWVDRRKLMPGQNWPRGFQCIVAIIQRELRNRSRAL